MTDDLIDLDAPELAAILQGRCYEHAGEHPMGGPAYVTGYELHRGDIYATIEPEAPGMVHFIRQRFPRKRLNIGIRLDGA